MKPGVCVGPHAAVRADHESEDRREAYVLIERLDRPTGLAPLAWCCVSDRFRPGDRLLIS